MGVDFTFFIISLFLLFSILISVWLKDILNPLLVLIVPIFIQYTMYYFYLKPVYLLSNKSNILLLLTLACFTIGFVFMFFMPVIKKRNVQYVERSSKGFAKIKKIFLFLGMLGFAWGLIIAVRFGLSGHGGFFFNIRYANTITGENSGGIADYLMFFLKIVTLSMIVFRKEWNVKFRTNLFLTVLVLISATFTMARTNLLLTLVSVLGVYVLTNRYIYKVKVNKSIVLFSSFGFLLLSYLFAVGTNKINGNGNIFFNYMAYPITAFDKFVVNLPFQSNGEFTFAIIYKVLNVVGLTNYTSMSIGDYVGLPPGQFNTFTLMSAPYLDFKTAGIILVFLSLGMLFGFIYKRVRLGKPYWIIFYSIMLYPLVISFFEYQFNLSTLIYYAFILMFVYIYTNMGKEKKLTNKKKH